MNRCSTWYPEDNMWGFVEKCSCVKIWRCVLTLPVAMLSMRSLDSTTVLFSNSYYTVVASIFLVSAASCKAIYEVTSVRTSDYSQPFWLKWHALLMPHVLIKYAHVLICISAGEGSRHFSAFHWICSHSRSAGPLYLKKQLIFVRNIHNSNRALHMDNKIFVKRPHQIPHA